MNLSWTSAMAIAVLSVGHVARAQPGEPRFAVSTPELVISSAQACVAAPAPAGAERAWQVEWLAGAESARTGRPALLNLDPPVGSFESERPAQEPTARRPVAVDYGKGSEIRLKIHKYASIATIPLFATETWLGQSLYNNPGSSESKRSAHGAVAASIGVLFGVNSVTGVWNLLESRKNPAGRTRRTVHGILMLAADAGFVATGLLAPDEEGGDDGRGSAPAVRPAGAGTHRAVALSSMGVALVSYLMMLVWRD
jgi:hypothetical protein